VEKNSVYLEIRMRQLFFFILQKKLLYELSCIKFLFATNLRKKLGLFLFLNKPNSSPHNFSLKISTNYPQVKKNRHFLTKFFALIQHMSLDVANGLSAYVPGCHKRTYFG
jgi:hypothetical protein